MEDINNKITRLQIFKDYLLRLDNLNLTDSEVMLKFFFFKYFKNKYMFLYKKESFFFFYEKYKKRKNYLEKKYNRLKKRRYMYIYKLLYIYIYRNFLISKFKMILYRLDLLGFTNLSLKLKSKIFRFFFFYQNKVLKKKKKSKEINKNRFFLFLKFTLNNIFVYVYDLVLKRRLGLIRSFYTKYFYLSLGKVGFEGPSKASSNAAFVLGLRFSKYLLKNQIFKINIILLNKPNLKYKEFIKGLLYNNKYLGYKFQIQIDYIYVMPKLVHNGCRLKKKRRV